MSPVDLFDFRRPKAKKQKAKPIVDMRRVQHADGSVCGGCGWPLHDGAIEYNGEIFCRGECALKKFGVYKKVRFRVVDAVRRPPED